MHASWSWQEATAQLRHLVHPYPCQNLVLDIGRALGAVSGSLDQPTRRVTRPFICVSPVAYTCERSKTTCTRKLHKWPTSGGLGTCS